MNNESKNYLMEVISSGIWPKIERKNGVTTALI